MTSNIARKVDAHNIARGNVADHYLSAILHHRHATELRQAGRIVSAAYEYGQAARAYQDAADGIGTIAQDSKASDDYAARTEYVRLAYVASRMGEHLNACANRLARWCGIRPGSDRARGIA